MTRRTGPFRSRRRLAGQLVAVAAATGLASTALLVGTRGDTGDGDRPTGPDAGPAAATTQPAAAPAPTAAATPAQPPATAGAGDPTGDPAATMLPAAVQVASGPIAVRYTFDAGAGRPIVDTSGRYPLRIAVAAGGAVRFVQRGTGWAVAFPPKCTAAADSCPRAILQGARADELNPGTRPVRFGASVRMTSADTSSGANVVQKGYSVGGSTQFKLQVDGSAGRPSCVLASSTKIYRTVASVGVANGSWHDVVCTRNGSALTISVDGTARGSVYVPPSLSIVNAEPLRIGGKGTNPGNDQYAGRIDNVFLTVS